MAKSRAITTRIRYMGRRRSRRRAKTTLPLAVIGGFAPLAMAGVLGWQGQSVHSDVAAVPGVVGVVKQLGFRLTGYSPDTRRWYPSELMIGVAPIVAGMFVHRLANRLGINRTLARTGIPLLRI